MNEPGGAVLRSNSHRAEAVPISHTIKDSVQTIISSIWFLHQFQKRFPSFLYEKLFPLLLSIVLCWKGAPSLLSSLCGLGPEVVEVQESNQERWWKPTASKSVHLVFNHLQIKERVDVGVQMIRTTEAMSRLEVTAGKTQGEGPGLGGQGRGWRWGVAQMWGVCL